MPRALSLDLDMGKYIDAEKLSTQIEKLFPNSSDERIVEGFEYALDKVKAIIDSLQQEQPEVDLEKEIRSMWEKCNPIDEGMGVESTYMHIEAFDIIVRHFFNLGLKARNLCLTLKETQDTPTKRS